MLKEAQDTEKELLEVISDSESKFPCRLDNSLKDIVREAFDFGNMKKYLSELGLDVNKLPVGKLSMDKITRGHNLLTQI